MHLLHENNVATLHSLLIPALARLNKVATHLPLWPSYLASPLVQIHVIDVLKWFLLDHLGDGPSQYIHSLVPLRCLASVHTVVDAPSSQKIPLLLRPFP